MNEAKTVWLSLNNLQDGLFPSECAVCLVAADGEVGLFVHKTQVDGGRRALKARILDADATHLLVQVATQGSGSTFKVPRSAVLSTAQDPMNDGQLSSSRPAEGTVHDVQLSSSPLAEGAVHDVQLSSSPLAEGAVNDGQLRNERPAEGALHGGHLFSTRPAEDLARDAPLFSGRPKRIETCSFCHGFGRIDVGYGLVLSPTPINGAPEKAVEAMIVGSFSVFDATREAAELALRAGRPVAFQCREHVVVIQPGDDPDLVARAWWIREHGETPEATFARR